MDVGKKRKLSLKERKFTYDGTGNKTLNLVDSNTYSEYYDKSLEAPCTRRELSDIIIEDPTKQECSNVSFHAPLCEKLTALTKGTDNDDKFTVLPQLKVKGLIEDKEYDKRDDLEDSDVLLDPNYHCPSFSPLPPFCYSCAVTKHKVNIDQDILAVALKELEDNEEFGTENERTVATKIISHPSTSHYCATSEQNNQRKDSTLTNEPLIVIHSDEDTNILHTCPMCQLQFAIGSGAMEIDAHLAQCLSAAGEDIIW